MLSILNIYKFIVKPRRGPSPILQVINDNKQDVTTDVLPFLGPNYDWHGNKLDSSFFNTKCLTFEMADGTTQCINFPDKNQADLDFKMYLAYLNKSSF